MNVAVRHKFRRELGAEAAFHQKEAPKGVRDRGRVREVLALSIVLHGRDGLVLTVRIPSVNARLIEVGRLKF